MTLNQKFVEMLEKANEDKSFNKFIFEFEGEIYFVEWVGNWTDPMKITFLK